MPLNFTKTALLLAILTAIFAAMGSVVGGETGLIVAFLMALGMNGLAFWKSDKMVLRLQKARRSTTSRRPSWSAWCGNWRRVPSCRCPAST